MKIMKKGNDVKLTYKMHLLIMSKISANFLIINIVCIIWQQANCFYMSELLCSAEDTFG